MRTGLAQRVFRGGAATLRRGHARRAASARLSRCVSGFRVRSRARRARTALSARHWRAAVSRTLLHRRRGQAGAWLRRRPAAAQPLSVSGAQVAGLEAGEKGTLDLGSLIILGTLGFGLQFGRWPAWAALAAVGGYFVWVVGYSEATVQARRLWPQPGRLTSPASSDQAPAPPPEEHRTA
jgi:hypothetical protein